MTKRYQPRVEGAWKVQVRHVHTSVTLFLGYAPTKEEAKRRCEEYYDRKCPDPNSCRHYHHMENRRVDAA